MFDFLEIGPLMDEAGAGDGGGGVAVADASSDFGGGEPGSDTDTGGDTGGEVHDAEFVEPSTELARVEQPETPVVKPGERAVQNGKFTQSGKAAIEALKPLSPRLAQEVTQSLLVRDWLQRELPGGKKELATLKQLAQQNGGEQGIAELKSIAQQMEEIDRMYAAADPNFIEKITETPDGQQSFVGLMEPALRKFDKLDPKRLAYYQAQGAVQTLNNAGLPTMFATQAAILNRASKAYTEGNKELAASFLAEIIDNHNSILGAIDILHQAAKNAPAALGSPADPKVQDGKNELERERAALRKEQWETSVANQRRAVFAKAWGELTKGRNLTTDQDSNIKGFYELRLTAKFRQWQNNAARFFANGDRDGYLKEQYTFFQKAIPDALRQAIAQALPGKPGPKPEGGPVKPPVNGKPATDRSGNAIRVAKMPPSSDLDVIKTTGAMLSENKAFTKDGRLVQWA
jgi:hypothetical protein